ncbi:MAG: DUF1206 domain-containing protein [Caldilineaceae bacterium]
MSTTEQFHRNQQLQRASAEAIPWVVWLARFGFAAKGFVYIVIGALAFLAAIGQGGQTTGPEGALSSIAQAPFGRILLGLVAIGLFGYALWRLVQAGIDPENEGTDAAGVVKRIGFAVSGIVYAGLGFEAARLALGASGGGNSGDGQAEDWTARLMAQPFGPWLVGLAGLIIIGTGLYQFYKAYSVKFREKLKLQEMSTREITWATRSGRIGFAARGVVYCIIGWFLIQAALRSNPQQAGGIGEALQELARQPYGPWLLGIVAVGLIGYGFFAFVLARYRRIFLQ